MIVVASVEDPLTTMQLSASLSQARGFVLKGNDPGAGEVEMRDVDGVNVHLIVYLLPIYPISTGGIHLPKNSLLPMLYIGLKNLM